VLANFRLAAGLGEHVCASATPGPTSLGLIAPGSPAHVPIRAQMHAINTELAKRANNQQAQGCQDRNN